MVALLIVFDVAAAGAAHAPEAGAALRRSTDAALCVVVENVTFGTPAGFEARLGPRGVRGAAPGSAPRQPQRRSGSGAWLRAGCAGGGAAERFGAG